MPTRTMREAPPPGSRAWEDVAALRQAIFQSVLNELNRGVVAESDTHRLELRDLEYLDPPESTPQQEKLAVLDSGSLGRRLRGTWSLVDKATGQEVARRRQVVVRVPYITSTGTIIDRGTKYAIINQSRLRPGVYARQTRSGEYEAHINVRPEQGVSHYLQFDPEDGQFRIRIGQARVPLYPVLKALGATRDDLVNALGEELADVNQVDDAAALKRALERFRSYRESPETAALPDDQRLKAALEAYEMDPWVVEKTLGVPGATRLSKEVYLAAARKLIRLYQGQDETDDRDHAAFQTILGPEDIIAESLRYDPGGWRRRVLRRVLYEKDLSKLPSGLFTPSLETALYASQLAQAVEETNLADEADRLYRVTRMGRGGIPSYEAVPDETRSVQPSHFGFLDFVRTPDNGERVGIDLFFTTASRKGADGRVYAPMFHVPSRRIVWVSPADVYDATIGSFDSVQSDLPRVPVLYKGRVVYRKPGEIDYLVPSPQHLFTWHTSLIPFAASDHIQRLSMGSRYMTQALPLVQPESPLVRPEGEVDRVREAGKFLGAIRADKPGRVTDVRRDSIELTYLDGTKRRFPLYVDYPANRKTFLHQTPVVTLGQQVAAGDLLARSNQTDEQGDLGLGRNLYTAYMSYQGRNFKDAIVISESAAQKLAAQMMFQEGLEVSPRHRLGKKTYLALFGSSFTPEQLRTIGPDGVVKPGTILAKGDPIILSAREREDAATRVHRKGQGTFLDDSVLWEREDPGEVVETFWGKHGPVVLVKSTIPVREGDKLSGLHGDKGVIGAILPDDQMPRDSKGRPFEVLLSPLGVISRSNPGQAFEGWMGLVAAAQGKPVYVPTFPDQAAQAEWVDQQLRRAGLSPTESVYDPVSDRKIPEVAVGNRYLMRLVHVAEDKVQGRAGGGYTSEGLPAKTGDNKAKRLALLDVNALLAHGAYEVLRDARMVRGQRNDVLWSQFLQGHIPEPRQEPLIYKKFIHQLQASGINVRPLDESRLQLLALTDSDVKTLTGDRVLQSTETVKFSGRLEPIPGGLFDPSLTGGHRGQLWAAIELPEPMPNPVMEDPIRSLLGLTKQEFLDVLAGKHEIPGFGTGPQAMKRALEAIDPKTEYRKHLALYGEAAASRKPAILKKLGYLRAAARLGQQPGEWMWSRVPVIPPMFRPVARIADKGIPLVADANFLYRGLWEAVDVFQNLKQQLPDSELGEERKAIYQSMKAIAGLGDPVGKQLVDRNVSGFLRQILGDSPKFGTVQQKLLGTTVDNVGRAVIVPDPDYSVDQVGLPENAAFDLYGRYVVRRLRRKGLSVSEAVRHWREQTPHARAALEEEMAERPILASRAPVLHKFGILAFRPTLVKGSIMRVNPFVLKGLNADFDGDTMIFHVPMTPKAVEEALDRLLPSKNLISLRQLRGPAAAPVEEDLLAGLYSLTEESDPKAQPKYFRTKWDVYRAWRAGQVNVNDPVVVLEG